MSEVKLSDYVWFQEGPGVRNTQYTQSGVKLLNVANLANGRVDISNTDRYISEKEAFGKYKHFLVDEGDLIIASSGIKVEYFDEKMGFVEHRHLPLCMNTSTIRFKTKDENKLDIRYFMYFLKSEQFKTQLSRQIVGSAQLNFGPSHLKKMHILLKEIDEQKEIVYRLDKISELIEKRKQQLEKLDLLVKAQFIEMFGGVTKEDVLVNLCTFIDYRGKTPPKTDRGLPFITAKNIKMHYMSFDTQEFISKETYDMVMTRGFPRVGDVVFTTEAPLGNVCRIPYIDTEFYIGQRIITMQTDCLEPIYLEYALASNEFRRKIEEKSSGSTVTGIRSKLLEKLTIPVPVVEQQRQFASFVEQTDKSKATIKRSLEKLETLKKALMQKYFG